MPVQEYQQPTTNHKLTDTTSNLKSHHKIAANTSPITKKTASGDRLRVKEAVAAPAFPPEGLVVATGVLAKGRVVDQHRPGPGPGLGPGRHSGHLHRLARAAVIAAVVAAGRD